MSVKAAGRRGKQEIDYLVKKEVKEINKKMNKNIFYTNN